MQLQLQNLITKSTGNGLAPVKGPRVIPVQLDFTLNASYEVEMTALQELDKAEFIQGVYADNSVNASPLIFFNRENGFTATIPPFSQGWVPLPLSNPPHIKVSTAASLVINVLFSTFPVPAAVWNSNGVIIVSPSLPVSLKTQQTAIAVSNTAVNLSASSGMLTGVTIKADKNNVAAIYVGNSGVTSANGFALYPGDSISIAVANTNNLWINGTAADFVYAGAN